MNTISLQNLSSKPDSCKQLPKLATRKMTSAFCHSRWHDD